MSAPTDKTADSGASWCALGELRPGVVVDEAELAQWLSRCPTSVRRAAERGDLPAPVKVFGRPV